MTEKREDKDLAKVQGGAVDSQRETPLGFEDEQDGDMIIPRVKIINALSPERKDKLADEGDIINSLTKDKLNGKKLIPVFKFGSNIKWRDRSAGGGIECSARDGKVGICSDGTTRICAQCKQNEFDNTKQGKESYPKCTKYINFFSFIEGEMIPIVLSFAKTNYNEGKKLYSLAKVTMQNMWNHGYVLKEKKLAKNGNEWYNIEVAAAGATDEEQRNFGTQLFKSFRNSAVKFDVDDNSDTTTAESGMASDEEIAKSEF
jgi:hypothetical protein